MNWYVYWKDNGWIYAVNVSKSKPTSKRNTGYHYKAFTNKNDAEDYADKMRVSK